MAPSVDRVGGLFSYPLILWKIVSLEKTKKGCYGIYTDKLVFSYRTDEEIYHIRMVLSLIFFF